MKKLFISGIGSKQSIRKEFHTIQFDIYKQQEFFSYFKKLLLSIGFKKDRFIENFGQELDELDHPTGKEENIKKYIDVCSTFENKDCKVIIFFGIKRIIMYIEAKTRLKQKIADKILSFCDIKRRAENKKKSRSKGMRK